MTPFYLWRDISNRLLLNHLLIAWIVASELRIASSTASSAFITTGPSTRSARISYPQLLHRYGSVVRGMQPSTSTSSQSPSSKTNDNKLGPPICEYHEVSVPTEKTLRQAAITAQDLTPSIRKLLAQSGLKQGTVTVISRHTTTAITINESESRLSRDMEQYFLKLAPPDERLLLGNNSHSKDVRYLHNDIEQRPESEDEKQRCRDNGWNIDDPKQLQAWRDQEPVNAHSHLLSMLLGSSESIPVVNCDMVIGQWQSILLVDLDPGPRDHRTVGIQLMGFQ